MERELLLNPFIDGKPLKYAYPWALTVLERFQNDKGRVYDFFLANTRFKSSDLLLALAYGLPAWREIKDAIDILGNWLIKTNDCTTVKRNLDVWVSTVVKRHPSGVFSVLTASKILLQ